MANRIEDAGVLRQFNFNFQGSNYRVYETTPKRTQDVFRFELWKVGGKEPYVVSFQDGRGHSGQCSCPAGLYHRAKGECKHVRLCRSEFLTASAAPTPASPARSAAKAPKALSSGTKALEAALEAKRSDYRRVKAMLEKARENVMKLEAELEATEKAGKAAKEALLKAQGGEQKALPF